MFKKIFVGIIAACMLGMNGVQASADTNDSKKFPILADEVYTNTYVTDFFGEQYFFFGVCATSPRKYNENEFEFFSEESNKRNEQMYDYARFDKYYLARTRINDFVSGSYKYKNEHHLYVYDENFTLIKDCVFNSYVSDMSYYAGEFYVELTDSAGKCKMQKSDDLNTWTNTEENMPIENNGICITSEGAVMSNGSKYGVAYEAEHELAGKSCGMFLWGETDSSAADSHVCVTADNIYYTEINEALGHYDFAYQYNGDIYFTNNSGGRQQKVSADSLKDAVETLEESPYVVYENKILAFEQPPVIRDGRTLIPLRFLFEQMGAEVTWNQEEQTATITQNDTSVTVGIDDTEAEVNGETVSMDVPARLINDKTMVPVRFLSEQLGYTVTWDGENRIITIE